MPGSPQTDITWTAGFVGTVDLSNANSTSGIWKQTGGISFVVFMVIGFCATLTLIAVVVTTVFFLRRYLLRRRAQRIADEEAAATVLGPKKLYVVVHPGGTADVAHREDDDQPREFVLKNKPIELSSAVIGVEDTIPAQWDEECQKSTKLEAPATEQLANQEEVAIEIYPLQDTARNQSYSRRNQSQHSWLRSSQGARGVEEAAESPRIGPSQRVPHLRLDNGHLGLTPRMLHSPHAGRWEERRTARLTSIELLSHRSAASEEHTEDLQLLTQRYH